MQVILGIGNVVSNRVYLGNLDQRYACNWSQKQLSISLISRALLDLAAWKKWVF